MSFTDQKPHIVTKKEYPGNWSGYKDGRRFRCYLCGHHFKIGDTFRWVHSKRAGNFMVCDKCDGKDVIDRWIKHVNEFKTKFWWTHDY